jgi:Fe2+ or Zn2+ uptake regulation protein
VTEEDDQHAEVSYLAVKENASVAAGPDSDNAVTHDQNELHQLDDGNHGLENVDASACALEGAQEVVEVHDHVNEGVYRRIVDGHQLCKHHNLVMEILCKSCSDRKTSSPVSKTR